MGGLCFYFAKLREESSNTLMNAEKVILNFAQNGLISNEENFFYCETRDQASSRLSRWIEYFKSIGFSINDSAILVDSFGIQSKSFSTDSLSHKFGTLLFIQWRLK